MPPPTRPKHATAEPPRPNAVTHSYSSRTLSASPPKYDCTIFTVTKSEKRPIDVSAKPMVMPPRNAVWNPAAKPCDWSPSAAPSVAMMAVREFV